MKLNLLPICETQETTLKKTIFLMGAVLLGTIAASTVMAIYSNSRIQASKQKAEELEPQAAFAYRRAMQANSIIKSGTLLERNMRLEEAIEKHNAAQIHLMNDVLQYIPGFFRVTSLTIAPRGAQDSLVTITGIVRTYQQYADVMMALMRMPGATQSFRFGFESKERYVPPLIEMDQAGQPIKPGQVRLPDDPWKRFEIRMDTMLKGTQEGGNHSHSAIYNMNPQTKKNDPVPPTPNESEVTLYVQVANRPMQVPNPRQTLAAPMRDQKRP